MGFIFGCMLIAIIGMAVWDFLTKPHQRGEMIEGYKKKPLQHLFLIAWMVFFLMFFIGIFVPILGQIEVTKSGWQVWEIGIIGFFGCFTITLFVDVEK